MKIRFLTAVLASLLVINGQVWAADLVIFSGRSDKFIKPVAQAFERKTGIKVVLHTGSSTALLNKLKLEAERTEADLYISNDAGNLQKGAEMGLFRPMDKDVLSHIPANYRSADNLWVGLSARARVLVVNANDTSVNFVKSVFDLADPSLKGKLAITHSSNESYIAGVTVYLRANGKEKVSSWLQGMKKNVSGKVYNKHSKIVNAVAKGKRSIGLVNHYYVYRHLQKYPDAPIKIVLPDQEKNGMGVAWNVAGVAITKYGKNSKEADMFIEFVVSEEGQKLFAEVNREYPTRIGVSASSEVPPLDNYNVSNVPMNDLGKYRTETLDLIESIGMP